MVEIKKNSRVKVTGYVFHIENGIYEVDDDWKQAWVNPPDELYGIVVDSPVHILEPTMVTVIFDTPVERYIPCDNPQGYKATDWAMYVHELTVI